MNLSEVRNAVALHRPQETDMELEINGAYPWLVTVQFDYEPAEPRTWGSPGCPASASIRSIKDRASGKEIMDRIPSGLVDAIASDLAGGK